MRNYYKYVHTLNMPSTLGRYNGNGNGSFGDNNGGGRRNGDGAWFICESTGHQAKQCPKG
jgi:hypothetical protein